MEDAIKTLFSLDKKEEGYSIQIVVWDNSDPSNWDDEFVIQCDELDTKKGVKRTTRRLTRFMNQYKKTPLKGKISK